MKRLGAPRLGRLPALAVPLLLAASLLNASCGRPEASPDSRPSLVLVVIDQLRKDSADAWMPGLLGLARKGVIFEQMRSAAPWTYPSVVSLMSGLYPSQHGATGHIRKNLVSTFDPDLPLLPMRLRAAGWHTAAFVANPFFHRFNAFHRGFDHYDVDFVRTQGNLRGLGSQVWTKRMFADSVNEAVLDYFGARPVEGPEFAYLHYIDVHGPWKDAPFPADYEAAVRFIDERVVSLYRFFRERHGGNLLFVVTSDHGRDLGDDLEVGDGRRLRVRKKSLHDFNLRIPLWILPGKPVRGPRRVDVSCSNVDVLPTLLDWLELDWPTPLPGVSLLPSISGTAQELSERPVYARNDAFGFRSDGVIRGGLKFLRVFDPRDGRPIATRAHDLSADPREERDLPERHAEAETLLDRMATRGGVRYESHFEATDRELLERLRALGYLRAPERKPQEP